MLTGRRFLTAFTPQQEEFAELIGDACRMVWNTGLEQRREYRRRGAFIGYVEQARQMTEAKKDFPWLAETPSHTLQQTLRDLEKACEKHGAWKTPPECGHGLRDRGRVGTSGGPPAQREDRVLTWADATVCGWWFAPCRHPGSGTESQVVDLASKSSLFC